MKVAVLVGEKSKSGERFVEQLNVFSEDTYEIIRYKDIIISILEGQLKLVDIRNNPIIDSYDLVYLRGIGNEALRHVIASYLNAHNIPVINTESLLFQSITKIEQYAAMAINGVPVPDTVYTVNPDNYIFALSLLGDKFPIVAKAISGSNGNDNILLNDTRSIKNITFENALFQPFIPNEFDYRVIVGGDQVLLAYKRIRNVSDESYKNNIGQGGTRQMVELPDNLKRLAIRACSAINREFGGVDILQSTDGQQTVVLEVNFNFGTPVFEDKVLERNYYQAVAKYFNVLTRD